MYSDLEVNQINLEYDINFIFNIFILIDKILFTSWHEKVIWIKQFETKQGEYSFDRKRSSIDEITVKKLKFEAMKKIYAMENSNRPLKCVMLQYSVKKMQTYIRVLFWRQPVKFKNIA